MPSLEKKWRQSSAFYSYILIFLRKLFIWLKQLKRSRKGIALLASYKPHTQFNENILSILVTFGLLLLQHSDTYREFNPKLAEERADYSKYETFSSLRNCKFGALIFKAYKYSVILRTHIK